MELLAGGKLMVSEMDLGLNVLHLAYSTTFFLLPLIPFNQRGWLKPKHNWLEFIKIIYCKMEVYSLFITVQAQCGTLDNVELMVKICITLC